MGFLVLLMPVAGWSEDGLSELIRNLSRHQAYSARFDQTMQSADGRRVNKVTGRLVSARPDRLYWETRSPYEQKLATQGGRVWFYDVDLEQVTIQSLDQQMSTTPALLLSGNEAAIRKQFRLVSVREHDGKKLWELQPRAKDSMLTALRVQMSGGVMDAMVIRDAMGQQTFMRFHDIELNPKVSSSQFNLKWPKGTDVITQ
jgi:outer membrane lipoprotein carrier protein